MLQRIQMLNRGQRITIFILIFGGGIALIVGLTLILLTFTINTQPRSLAQPLVEGVTVREFAELPDEDAYPANLAVNADGILYTGSYESGAIYEILPDGQVLEIPQTRLIIGSVTGLTVAPDGYLYVFDRLMDNPRSSGGVIWRFFAGDVPREWGLLSDESGFVSPEDIIALPDGTVFVADRGRFEVLRFSADGIGEVFWGAHSDGMDDTLRPTGLAYDEANNALIVTDSGENRLFRVPLDGSPATLLYAHPENDAVPDFTGVTLGANGEIYVAALGGGVMQITPDDEEQPSTTLAINFRGARDIAFYDGKIYVTNFDSASLVNPLVNPQLPFAIDVIEFE